MISGRRRIVLLGIAGIGLLSAAAYFIANHHIEKTDDAALDAHIVAISSKVAGYVSRLHVNDNQQVKEGDVLVEINDTDYRNRVAAAEGDYLAAKARYEQSVSGLESTRVSAPSGLEAAKAQVQSAQAAWEKASRDLKRTQEVGDLARSKQDLDHAIAEERSARAALADAQARLRSAETAPQTVAAAASNTKSLEAGMRKAWADVEQAREDLKSTKILAPYAGTVTRKGIEEGAYMQPGQQMFWLVGNDIWVTANFKETQLTDMRPGQKAHIHVDAYPDLYLTGTVDSIQSGTGARFSLFPPENATGNFVKIVQRVPVKILLDKAADPALALGPGMSVVVKVETAP